ncbi:MAG: pyruvate formate lyase family protein, partial [Waddliaceae bacterium]
KIVGMDSNRAIQETAKKLVDSGKTVEFRMVIIPGKNDSEESLRGIADFLSSLKVSKLTLLKYTPGGEHKIEGLDTKQRALGITEEESKEAIRKATRFFTERGIEVHRNDGEDERPPPPIEVTPRVAELREAVRAFPYSICLERDTLLTEFCRKNPKKPGISEERRRAEAFAYVLSKKTATIYPKELLVGNFTSKRVGGHPYMDYHGIALAPVLWGINRRKVNPIRTTFAEMATYYGNLLPYWAARNVIFSSFPTLGKTLSFVFDQLSAKEYATPLVAGVSHFVPNYQKLLELGTAQIIEQLEEKMRTSYNPDFYQSVIKVLKGLENMAQNFATQARIMAATLEGIDEDRRKELLKIAETCEQVPKYPALSFQQALQAILFCQIGLICETSQHGVAIGRIDQLLYPYYRADIIDGRITKEKARELLHCFYIKINEYVSVMPPSGAKLYSGVNNGQAADAGGRDPVTGKDSTNELSYLCVEAFGLGLKGPNGHARLHRDSPKDFVDLVAKVLCSGSPVPSVFNEDIIIPTLRHFHPKVSEIDIRNFGIVGCCEICPARSFPDTDNALVNIAHPLEQALETDSSRPITFTPTCIENVIDRYTFYLDKLVKRVVDDVQYLEIGHRRFPTMLSTALIDGTLESGKDVNAGGAKYNSSGIQGVGLADVCDSLYAIDQAVFRQHLCTWKDLIIALRNNFSGQESLRTKLLNLPKYGNGIEDVDVFAEKVMKIFTASLARFTNTRGGPYIPGWYAMTTHTNFGKFVKALPSGRAAGAPLGNGLSPGLGTERLGPTAVLNSAGLDLENTAGNGVIVNLKLHQLLLTGQRGIDTVSGLLKGYFEKGGMQVQFNILDPQVLIDALHHPENHRDLIVRISGYAAYFNDLSPEMKQAIIERTLHVAG